MKIVNLILFLLFQTFLTHGAFGDSTFVATQLLMDSALEENGSDINGNEDSVKIIYGNAAETEKVYRKAFSKDKWRKQGEQYLYCPGEYRVYAGVSRCRVPGTGFNGVMGGMVDADTTPLFNQLAKDYNLPGIKILSVEQTPDTLSVEFAAAESGQGIQDPVLTVSSRISPKQWVKRDQQYFFCPGEYRTYFGEKRCRSSDDGLNGVMGGMVDEQEIPLEAFLAKEQGWTTVNLVHTEKIGGSLQAIFSRSDQEDKSAASQTSNTASQSAETVDADNGALIATAATSGITQGIEQHLDEDDSSITIADGELKEEFILGADREQYPKEIGLILAIVDSGFFKFIAFTMIFVGLVNGIVRQSILHWAVGIAGGIGMLNAPTIFRTILATPTESPGANSDPSGTSIFIILAIGLAIAVVFNVVKQYLSRRRLNDLSAVLASIDELERRQQGSGRDEEKGESVTDDLAPISNSLAEELEVDKRRRKIILD